MLEELVELLVRHVEASPVLGVGVEVLELLGDVLHPGQLEVSDLESYLHHLLTSYHLTKGRFIRKNGGLGNGG